MSEKQNVSKKIDSNNSIYYLQVNSNPKSLSVLQVHKVFMKI